MSAQNSSPIATVMGFIGLLCVGLMSGTVLAYTNVGFEAIVGALGVYGAALRIAIIVAIIPFVGYAVLVGPAVLNGHDEKFIRRVKKVGVLLAVLATIILIDMFSIGVGMMSGTVHQHHLWASLFPELIQHGTGR